MTGREIEFVRPGIARVTTDRYGRWYEWQGQRYWSVTTILKAKANFGLLNWFPKYTAEYAVGHLPALNVLAEDDTQGAIDWLKNAHDRYSTRRADIGSRIHDHAEAHVLEQPMPPIQGDSPEETGELEAILASFHRYLDRYQPRFLMVEAPVFNKTEQYAGTLDSIADYDRGLFSETDLGVILGDGLDEYMASGRDEIRLLADYKTGKGVYEDVALQLSPYREAEYVGLPDGLMDPMPKVDGAVVVHLRDGVMDVYPVSTSASQYKSFLHIREVYRWQRDLRKGALGKPVVLENQQIALDT